MSGLVVKHHKQSDKAHGPLVILITFWVKEADMLDHPEERTCPGHQTDDEYHFMMTCEKYKADKDSLYSSIMRLSCPNIITLTNKAWKINLYIYGSWYRNTDHKMQSPPRCYGCRVWWCRHWDLCLDTRMMDHVEPNSCFMYYFAWKCLCIYM